MTIEYEDFVRKPFTVKAVEITIENIAEIAQDLGVVKYKEDDGTPYIAVKKGAVPNVSKVYPGWYMTKMGKRTHCYAPNVFFEQFEEMSTDWEGYFNSVASEEAEPATV